jgi:hypothetical protein
MGKGLPGGRRQAGSIDYRTNRGASSVLPRIDRTTAPARDLPPAMMGLLQIHCR